MVKVLIVEDSEIMVSILSPMLKRNGYNITVVNSGEACLKLIKNESFNLILMDIALSGRLDGVTTAKILLEKYNINVIYLTAKYEREIWNKAKTTKPYGYIVKPFRWRDLQIAMEIALEKNNEK